MVGASIPGGFELEDREASPVEVSRAVPASHPQHGPAATDRRDAFRARVASGAQPIDAEHCDLDAESGLMPAEGSAGRHPTPRSPS